MLHKLKTLQPFFDEVYSGEKTFEVRKDDRGFHVGDLLLLQEWSEVDGYTGREELRLVSFILPGGWFGIEPGYCCMSLKEYQPND